jgi:dTDP-4-dehydrorhamnose 3,5-epimerase
MKFRETQVSGAFLIEPEKNEDERGFFARAWCRREFKEHGLNPRLVQSSISFNKKKGTLRGMHYQVPPFAEAKLVRCTRGSIYDVVIDLRKQSSTFKRHVAVVLSAENHNMLYIPEGCAHGFQTLEDNAEVFYQMSEFYSPGHARGVKWNDPAFGIAWPIADPIILERDRTFPDFIS